MTAIKQEQLGMLAEGRRFMHAGCLYKKISERCCMAEMAGTSEVRREMDGEVFQLDNSLVVLALAV